MGLDTRCRGLCDGGYIAALGIHILEKLLSYGASRALCSRRAILSLGYVGASPRSLA